MNLDKYFSKIKAINNPSKHILNIYKDTPIIPSVTSTLP